MQLSVDLSLIHIFNAFTGSPEGLYTVDFVCHGTPSPKVFQEYLKDRSRKSGADLAAVDFRIKRPSWSVSVSYTHLDVYKRQVHEWLFVRLARGRSGALDRSWSERWKALLAEVMRFMCLLRKGMDTTHPGFPIITGWEASLA